MSKSNYTAKHKILLFIAIFSITSSFIAFGVYAYAKVRVSFTAIMGGIGCGLYLLYYLKTDLSEKAGKEKRLDKKEEKKLEDNKKKEA